MDSFLSSLDHKFLKDFAANEKLPALTVLLQWSLHFLQRTYPLQKKTLHNLKLFLGDEAVAEDEEPQIEEIAKEENFKKIEAWAEQTAEKKIAAEKPSEKEKVDFKHRKPPVPRQKRKARELHEKPSSKWRKGDQNILKETKIHPDWWYYEEWVPSCLLKLQKRRKTPFEKDGELFENPNEKSPYTSPAKSRRKRTHSERQKHNKTEQGSSDHENVEEEQYEPVKAKRRVKKKSKKKTRKVGCYMQPCQKANYVKRTKKTSGRKKKYTKVRSKIKEQILRDKQVHEQQLSEKREALKRFGHYGLDSDSETDLILEKFKKERRKKTVSSTNRVMESEVFQAFAQSNQRTPEPKSPEVPLISLKSSGNKQRTFSNDSSPSRFWLLDDELVEKPKAKLTTIICKSSPVEMNELLVHNLEDPNELKKQKEGLSTLESTELEFETQQRVNLLPKTDLLTHAPELSFMMPTDSFCSELPLDMQDLENKMNNLQVLFNRSFVPQ